MEDQRQKAQKGAERMTHLAGSHAPEHVLNSAASLLLLRKYDRTAYLVDLGGHLERLRTFERLRLNVLEETVPRLELLFQ